MSELSYLEKLLDGAEVEWLPLGDIANIYGGLTGKSKADFEEGNAKYISYKNIFSNINIDEPPTDFVNINDGERQHTVKYGDVLFTGSSETAEEAGISSAITSQFDEQVYLNSFSFGIRFNKKIKIKPEFSKYLFRTNLMREQISKTASGVTRFNISKSRFKKILIPVISPENQEKSLAIQSKIVRILDKFTALTAELTAELTARKKQYHYYRDQLLSFDDGEVEYLPMGDKRVGEFIRGGTFQKKDFTDFGVGCIHYGQIYTYYGTYTNTTKTFISESLARKCRKAESGNLIIATTSENDDDVCKAVAWLGYDDIAVSSDACIYKHKLNPKYVSYFFQTECFQHQKKQYITGAKVRRVNASNLAQILIPVPSPEEQARIVAILDKFDTLTSSITEGLPREIELRQKQYEYYRDLLFSFPEPESVNN
ncbi:TPA: restriction endonuclease subunit S [Morganella morganii]|nr:restriction endonuclease subunit S [Morganella morganii]